MKLFLLHAGSTMFWFCAYWSCKASVLHVVSIMAKIRMFLQQIRSSLSYVLLTYYNFISASLFWQISLNFYLWKLSSKAFVCRCLHYSPVTFKIRLLLFMFCFFSRQSEKQRFMHLTFMPMLESAVSLPLPSELWIEVDVVDSRTFLTFFFM